MSTKAYYDSEIAAGQSQAAVLADLNSQKANEDAALLASLGGSFTAANVGELDAVKATTLPATPVAGAFATLRGSVTLGRDTVSSTTAEQAALSFEWGTDANLLGSARTSATPATATGSTSTRVTTAASAALSGLTNGLTYYYRLVAVTDAGLETEAVLEGTISSFTTTGTTAQPLSFEAGADMVVGAAARPYPFAPTASGNPVVLASANAAICTVAEALRDAGGTWHLRPDGECRRQRHLLACFGDRRLRRVRSNGSCPRPRADAGHPADHRRRARPPRDADRPTGRDADNSTGRDAGPDADYSTGRDTGADTGRDADRPTGRDAGQTPANPPTGTPGEDAGHPAGPDAGGRPASADAGRASRSCAASARTFDAPVCPAVTARPTAPVPAAAAVVRDTPRAGLVPVPAVLPRDGGPMRRRR
jgi:hypothetical protein